MAWISPEKANSGRGSPDPARRKAGRARGRRAEELGREALTIEPESSTVFELEWYWRDNDAADTAAGENGAVYRLKISLSAHVFHG